MAFLNLTANMPCSFWLQFFWFSPFHNLQTMCDKHSLIALWAVYTEHVFTSKDTLLLRFSLPFIRDGKWKARPLTDRSFSCISVTWVSPQPRNLRRLEALLSPFILKGGMNVITDYDEFFCPIVTKIHIAPIFHKTHILQTFWHKNGIF